jgi:hypothetical protein
MMRMWEVWSAGEDQDRPIDFGDLEKTGGLASALSNHADELYDSLPGELHRTACEKIFKALTEKGSDNRGIRRPTRLAELQAIADCSRDTVQTVLNAFRASGVTFVMPGTDELDVTVLDLSREPDGCKRAAAAGLRMRAIKGGFFGVCWTRQGCGTRGKPSFTIPFRSR